MDEVYNILQSKLSLAKRNDATERIVGHGENFYSYEDLSNELKKLIEHSKVLIERCDELNGHFCEYGEDDYCIHCGNDGRA